MNSSQNKAARAETNATPLAMAAAPAVFEAELTGDRFADLLKDLKSAGHSNLAERLASGNLARLFAGVATFSPYLTRLTLREAEFLARSVDVPPLDACEAELARLSNEAPALEDSAALMSLLRMVKARVALLAALADIGGLWDLAAITAALSRLADMAVSLALAHEVRALYRRQELENTGEPPTLAAPAIAAESGIVVLALGKLGGRELNYSSDIDLIVLYDEEKLRYSGRRTMADACVRLTQRLVALLQERTADGYVFRVDLRLRPDPGATPVAVSMGAAESYYQSIGQTWERSAFIKARVIAGDFEAGAQFIDRIRPFVWRRHLDFAAIDDIHAMKARVHEHHQHGDIGFAGHDVKLGLGGIREIEFFAQIHQLIAGGRRPDLHTRATLDTLRALAAAGDIGEGDMNRLAQAYNFLRRVEHRLQMIDDQQTQTVPADAGKRVRFCRFLGHDDPAALEREFIATLGSVHELYEKLLPRPAEPAIAAEMPRAGFANQDALDAALERWRSGRYRALRTARAQRLFSAMLPDLLGAFAKAADPDQALARFDQFLGQLPAGVQLFALFHANRNLFGLIARIMCTAPALAEQLARRPVLLDSVLGQDFFLPPPAVEGLEAELSAKLSLAADYQDVLDQARIWLNERRFQVGVLMLDGLIDPLEGGAALSRLADATLTVLLPRIEAEFAGSAGTLPGCEFAVLALGSYGARALTYTSDLDLVFLYRCPEGTTGSTGTKKLPPGQYYSRLSQRIISALTVLTGEGRLFEIDMRLRPSGRAGIIAVSLDAFASYQVNEAWAWEHMTLTKARVVAGAPDLCAAAMQTICEILARPRDPRALAAAIWDMRRRFDDEFGTGGLWDLKTGVGGLAAIDWLVQYLLLCNGAKDGVPDMPDVFAQVRHLENHNRLDSDAARRIDDAYRLMFSARAVWRLLIGPGASIDAAAPDIRTAFATALGEANFIAASENINRARTDVADLFAQLVPKPAETAAETPVD